MSNDAFNAPYGNAPRELDPQWPNVNLYGRPLVQPQPNPYFAHWPQQLGQTNGTGGFPWMWLLLAGAAAGVGYLVLKGSAEADEKYEVRLYKKGGGTTYKGFATKRAADLYLGKQMDTGKYRDGDVSQLGAD